jgi:hypothetical protein
MKCASQCCRHYRIGCPDLFNLNLSNFQKLSLKLNYLPLLTDVTQLLPIHLQMALK